jgi:hypothetical protein
MTNGNIEYIALLTTGTPCGSVPAGQLVEVAVGCKGLETGYGRVVNGWAEGLEHFDKYDDGDTVVEAEADDQGAMPIADAYWLLGQRYASEYAEYAADAVYGGYGTAQGEVDEWISKGCWDTALHILTDLEERGIAA